MKMKFAEILPLKKFTYNGVKYQKYNNHQGKCLSTDAAVPLGTMVFFDPNKIVVRLSDD